MNKRNAGFQTWTLVAIVATVGGVAWYGSGPGHWFTEKPKEVLLGAAVQHGPLRISVIEHGSLKAADSVSITSGIEGQATILFLIPEGRLVKEGDLVCELDATSLVDKSFQQRISVSNADAAFVKAEQNYHIQESQNDSDIAKAKQKLLFAETDLEKFKADQGERTNQLAKADEQITLASERYKQAESKLDWSNKLFEKGFLTKTELDTDELSFKSAGIQRDAAVRERDLLKTFQLERTKIELESGLAEANRELVRVNLQAIAHIVDYKNDKTTKEAQLTLEREKLQKLETQIGKAKIHAPRAGMVVYGQEEGGRYMTSQPMKEGTQVRERQEIITIPNAGGMIAQASLHESILKQIELGQNCVVKIDAIGPREFHGKVNFVAVLPDQNSWFANPNTRLYRTEIAISDGIPDMRPGMSCQIEILVEDIVDATYAPVQCVFRTGSDNIAFVVHGGTEVEQRKLEVGKYNERWVQILSGAKDGEILAMSPPAGFVPEAAKESAIEANTPPAPGAAPSNPGQRGPGGPGGDGGQPSGRGNRGDAAGADAQGRGAQDANGGGSRGQMTDEQRAEFQKRMANMTEEERTKAMEEFRNKRRGGGGAPAGSPGGESGGATGASPAGAPSETVPSNQHGGGKSSGSSDAGGKRNP